MPRPRPTSQDSPWPLAFAFVVLIGSLAAVVATILGFEAPEWFTSIWLWTPLLAVTAIVLLVAAERSSETLRRRMRSALILSLVAHLILAIYLKDQFLAFVTAPKELDETVEIEPLPTLPQFYFRPPESETTSEAFEQPVTASVPQPAPVLERLEAEIQINIDRAPTPRQLPNETPVPAPMPFERAEVSVPRRASDPGQLSRQDANRAELEPRAADAPRYMPERQQRSTPVSAATTEVARSPNTPARRRRPTNPSQTAVNTPSPQPTRVRQSASSAADSASTPQSTTLARRAPQRRQTITTETLAAPSADAPQSAARQSNSPTQLNASSTAIARTRSAARPTRQRRSARQSSAQRALTANASGGSRQFERQSANGSTRGQITSSNGSNQETTNNGRGPTRRQTGAAQLAAAASAEPLSASDGQNPGDNDAERGELGQAVAGLAPRSDAGNVGRRRSAIPVRNRAARGAGGLGYTPSTDIGVASRRASSESSLVHSTPSRFLQRRSAGPATLGSQSRTTAEPFARRGLRRTQQASNDPRRPSAATDLAIERGLQYLATVQASDGRWSLQRNSADPSVADKPARIVADSAATGMALLAFLGAGYDHFGDDYQEQVAHGLQFLVENQQANGDLYIQQRSPGSSGVWFYSHGIAAMALCEAYGMTGDETLKAPAQAALDFIVVSQSPQRGGWRYEPRVSSDLSVSGWQIMALKSGQLAGLNVPATTLARARKLLDETQVSRGTFVYNPWAARAAETRNDRSPSCVMTSVGLLMQLYTGQTRDDPSIREGADLIRDHLAEMKQPYVFAGLNNPNRDTYYWYNATQVMFHMQGNHWQLWNERLYPMLAETQVKAGALAGSWHPTEPIPDRWGAYAGRVYVTALNLLSLEVYYRHLPLFDEGLASN